MGYIKATFLPGEDTTSDLVFLYEFTTIDTWELKGKGIVHNVRYPGPDIARDSFKLKEVILDGALRKVIGVESWAKTTINTDQIIGILVEP